MSKSLSLTEQLAKHLLRKVDSVTRERARLHLLDWLGCVAGARNAPIASVAFAHTSGDAVHISAYLGNILEQDDVHRESILHPGPVIWPTVLAGHSDMTSLLDSSIRGYEAMICVGSSFDRHHYQHWHSTSTAGIMGAAVAACGAYGKSRSQLVNALGNAGSVSGGIWQMRHESVMTKQFHVAHAFRTGLEIAHLSKCGLTGPKQILEGEQGLYAATCKNPRPLEFPKNWRIGEVSFKPWGACRHAHPAIDAALELQALLGNLDGEIMVETYADAITFCDNSGPKTPQQAKFSIQHAVAVIATTGAPALADFDAAAIRKHAKSRARVTVRECTDITARYPKHYGARVTCRGQTVEMIDTLGDPERPMTDTQIIDKACSLMAWGGLSKKQADKAVKLALEGDEPLAIRKMLGKWLA